ncbi:MAG: glycosyltransferase family 39 protein [Pirellulaceae bacterium]|nr:glycosyltransferase family 39 protein [Pirellulaceae bacterium]
MLAPRMKQAVLVALVAVIVMFTNLGGPRLWDRDEPRNAGCAKEMLERWDWVVPTFNGRLRTHKPVLLYWGIMLSYGVLGVSEFAARLPSALAAVGSVLCTWFIGRRLFSPEAGVWGAIALATSLMFGVAGRAATPDSVLILCTTLAIAIYVGGTFRPRFDGAPDDLAPQLVTPGHYFPQSWPVAIAMYGVMGVGILAKGPVGLVLPTAIIGMFLLIARLPAVEMGSRLTLSGVLLGILRPFEPVHFLKTCWYMRPLTAIFAAAAVAVPWYWAVGLATEGDFIEGFFFEHHVGRATSSMENHSGGPLFYPVAMLAGFFPWSVFAVPIILETAVLLRRRENRNVGYILAACWVLVFLGAFTIARTKLPSYITPCYPGLALLAGAYVDRWSRDRSAIARWWMAGGYGVLAFAGAGFMVAVPLVAEKYLPGDEWLGLLGLTPLAVGVACVGLALVQNYKASLGVFAAGATIFATLLFAVGAQRADHHQTSHVLLRAAREHADQPRLATYRVLEPSWVFYAGEPITELPRRPRDKGQTYVASDVDVSRVEMADQPGWFLGHSGSFVITTRNRLDELAGHLPTGVEILAETPRFLRDDQLVLLGYRDQPESVAARRKALDAISRKSWR